MISNGIVGAMRRADRKRPYSLVRAARWTSESNTCGVVGAAHRTIDMQEDRVVGAEYQRKKWSICSWCCL